MRLMSKRARSGRLRVAGRGERGAIATIVAIIMVPLALGATMLSVDVGQLLWERSEVQNAADATAMAAAAPCATTTSCNPDLTSTSLSGLANRNARDNSNAIQQICASVYLVGRGLSTLPVCPTLPNPGLVDCPTVSSSYLASPYVEVRTRTRTSSGSASISSRLASIVAGHDVTTTVRACARATWGPAAPSKLTVFPIIMSYCDWRQQTGYDPSNPAASTSYPNPPNDAITPYGYGAANPWPSLEQKIYTKNNPTTCPTWNGHSAPGGFYSLAGGSGCTANVVLDGWVQGVTGNSNPCGDPARLSSIKGTVVYIPVFDCRYSGPTTITATTNCNSGSGSNTYYHVAGYGAFYVTGWYFSNSAQASIRSGVVPCSNGDRCVSGWFLKDLVPSGDIVTSPPGGTPNFGFNVVKPIG